MQQSRSIGHWRWKLLIAAGLAAVLQLNGLATPTVVNTSFNGRVATANFQTKSADGCIRIVIEVIGVDGESTHLLTGHTVGLGAEVVKSVIDDCNARVVFSGGNEVAVTRDQLTIDRGLGSAALRATVPISDFGTGQPATLDVDVTWTATSLPDQTKSTFHQFFVDGSRQLLRSSGIARGATATGTVSDGGVNLTPDPDDSAFIQSIFQAILPDGSKDLTRSSGILFEALATGSIIGGSVNLSSIAPGFASIESAKDGERKITR